MMQCVITCPSGIANAIAETGVLSGLPNGNRQLVSKNPLTMKTSRTLHLIQRASFTPSFFKKNKNHISTPQ